MSDVNTEAPAAPTASETDALAAAKAGYAKATGNEPPAEDTTSQTQAPASSGDALSTGSDGEPEPTESAPEPTPAPTAAPAQPSMQEELAALKQRVLDLQNSGGASQQEVRRLHGQVGDLQRTIKALQTPTGTPASEDALAAALKRAEAVATEYPEIGEPMVQALQELSKRVIAQPPAQAPADTSDAAASEPQEQPQGYTPEQQAAIKALDEAHPDRHQVKQSPDYQSWFAKQTPEYQQMVNTTWNPAVVSDCFARFKSHRAAEQARAAQEEANRKRKQDRLAASETPQGVPGKAQPTVLPDEAGYRRGYERFARRA